MEREMFVKICKACSETSRVAILDQIADKERCACELLENLHIHQSTLSYHMKQLSECGLVDVRAEGKWNYYRINQSVMAEFLAYMKHWEG